MTQDSNSSDAMRMATDIVIAMIAQGRVDPSQVPTLVKQVRMALTEPSDATPALHHASGPKPAMTTGDVVSPTPAFPVEESVHPEYLVSLEDGKHYRSLKRHLMAKYGLTPEAYRRKWGLPPDYPMVAPDYARQRSEVARRIGLGKPAKTAKPVRARKSHSTGRN